MLNVIMVIVKIISAINDDAFMRVFFMLNFVMLGVVKRLVQNKKSLLRKRKIFSLQIYNNNYVQCCGVYKELIEVFTNSYKSQASFY